MGQPDDSLSIRDIAKMYRKSPSLVRLRIKKELEKQPDLSAAVQRPGRGPIGMRYEKSFVDKVFEPGPDQNLSSALKRVIYREREPSADVVLTTLTSRQAENPAYQDLLSEMIKSGKGLRIRCVTGTDFFNEHQATAPAFASRATTTADITRVILVWPFGDAARVRCTAEGDTDIQTSQFARDARSTFEFIYFRGAGLGLDAKWVDETPTNLVVWTEDYALLEPYGYGLPTEFRDHRRGIVGRHAPLLVIRGGTPYHSILKDGFDYVFEIGKHMSTYSLQQVAKEYGFPPIAAPAQNIRRRNSKHRGT